MDLIPNPLGFIMAISQISLTSSGTMSTPAFSEGLLQQIMKLPEGLPNLISGIPWVLDMMGSGYLVGMG